jgi:hypothetical protein
MMRTPDESQASNSAQSRRLNSDTDRGGAAHDVVRARWR